MAIQVEITGRSLLRSSASYDVGEMVPLSVFDSASTDGYIPIVFAWNAPAPANCALTDGLLAAVAMFPRLAGRFAVDDHGKTCFHLNNAGVLVVEASAAADLADELGDDGHVTQLYPRAEKESADDPVLQVQLTRYTCGGLVIGMASHHQAADGQSMSSFATVWANAVRTKSAVHLVSSPFHGHVVGINPRIPPAPAFDHRNIEFKGEQSRCYGVVPLDRIKNLAAHFPDEFVAGLKARVAGPGKRPSSSSSSTFKCLLAHVWKKVTVARDLAPDEFTQVRVAVSCRGRAKPPVPTEFFGNMVLWAFPRMKVRELLSSSYEAVVGAISDAIARVDDDYIKSFVDFGSAGGIGIGELEPTAATLGTVFCPDLEVDSWLGFRFHDLDFGCGPPCAFLPPDLPIDGVMVFVPSCATKGGVDLFMGLNHDHVQAFNNICYSMDD